MPKLIIMYWNFFHEPVNKDLEQGHEPSALGGTGRAEISTPASGPTPAAFNVQEGWLSETQEIYWIIYEHMGWLRYHSAYSRRRRILQANK